MPVEPSASEVWTSLFRSMKELRAVWPSRGWSWDRRLSCVTSSFADEVEAKARTVATGAFPSEWTSSTIQRAPALVRELVERAGGIRSGQLVLTTGTATGPFVYCLWWPWGDGMTTSVRIGLGASNPSQDGLQRLRDSFGVEV
jgi:hypothetical protein